MTKNKAISPSWKIHLIRNTKKTSHKMANNNIAIGWSVIQEEADNGKTDNTTIIKQWLYSPSPAFNKTTKRGTAMPRLKSEVVGITFIQSMVIAAHAIA